jgi:signal transduction histidine kinase
MVEWERSEFAESERSVARRNDAPARASSKSRSLRVRVALAVAAPIFLALSLLSLVNYARERRIFQDQLQRSAQQLGEVTLGSLRHAMLVNDRGLLAQVVDDLAAVENDVLLIQIIDLEKQVRVASEHELVGSRQSIHAGGCEECHRLSPAERPRTIHLESARQTLRISTPIQNEPACSACHQGQGGHLGVMLIDVSLADTQRHTLGDLQLDLGISLAGTFIVSLCVYFLVHWLVVRRIESFREPLAALSQGNLSARLPLPDRVRDELDELGLRFNSMAADLQRHAAEEAERSQVRQRAIVEERERIARELHDGMAQLLGYVNTKVMAVRLLLSDGKMDAAKGHLLQLEEAARELFSDLREAILGLRLASASSEGLVTAIREFTDKFNRLNDLSVDLSVDPDLENPSLPPEAELQVLRIVQEALSNARKHAQASQAWIILTQEDGILELTIGDDGVGFNPGETGGDQERGFGLTTMRERSEAIGAQFVVDSEPEGGTRISLRIPMGEGG